MSAGSVHGLTRFAALHWYRLSPVSLLLFPFSLLFGLLVLLRRLLYRAGLLRTIRLPVPVLVIGNLTVGGTGKTPLVLWIAGALRAAGRTPGIVLRGYGSRDLDVVSAVMPDSDPYQHGDEAVLLAGRAKCPVWSGRDRVAAAQALLAAHPECDVILCDDGLQHYRLGRDFEIAVEDGRGHGNGLLLPAGPLREPAGRAVDVTVVNGETHRSISGRTFHMHLVFDGLVRLAGPGDAGEAVAMEGLSGKRLHAVAGIGNPQRFFDTLSSLGIAATPHAFPDHHAFASSDLDFDDCDAVLMTEKDGVKCRSFGRKDLIMLRVAAETEPALADLILKALHGRPTA